MIKSILSINSENTIFFCEWIIGVPDKYKEEEINAINQMSNYSNPSSSISYSSFVCLLSEQFYPIMQVIWNYRKRFELISMLWLNAILESMKANQTVLKYVSSLIPISKKFTSIQKMISEIVECHENECRIFIMSSMGMSEKGRIINENKLLVKSLFNESNSKQIYQIINTNNLKTCMRYRDQIFNNQYQLSLFEMDTQIDDSAIHNDWEEVYQAEQANEASKMKQSSIKFLEEIPLVEETVIYQNENQGNNSHIQTFIHDNNNKKELQSKKSSVKNYQVMKIVAKSITNDKLKVKFKIIPNNDSSNLNFFNCCSEFRFILDPMQTDLTIIYLFKKDVNNNWGEFDFNTRIKVIEKASPSMNDKNEETKLKGNIESKKEGKTQKISICPNCKYQNPFGAQICQKCKVELEKGKYSIINENDIQTNISHMISQSKVQKQSQADSPIIS